MGADLKWVPEIPADDALDYDPALAMQILDEAGYVDSDGDGTRNLPDGGENIVLRHAVNTDTDLGASVGELFSGWMSAIGIGVQLDSYDQDTLFGVIVDGTYDTFYWGWVPFIDPDPMLSYFTEAEIGNYNDANWFDPAYDALYTEQNQELDPERRLEIVHEMVKMIYDNAGYNVLWYSPDVQAYRVDGAEGWVRQPADNGPIIFSQSSPSYPLLQPVGSGGTDDNTATTVASTDSSDVVDDGTTATTAAAGGDDDAATTVAASGDSEPDGGGSGSAIAIGIAAVAAVLGGVAIGRRRKSADERE
jgi:peptide/nickel transport system substrate-binding protein